MPIVSKTYISMVAANFNRGPSNIEIADEADAVKKTLAQRCIAFTTYQVASLNVNGQELKSEPSAPSGRRYVGIDRLYTRDEVLEEIKKPLPGMLRGHPGIDDIFNEVTKGVTAAFMQHPANSAYITGLERPGEFIRLTEGEKAFDRNGTQLWPRPAGAPAPTQAFKP